ERGCLAARDGISGGTSDVRARYLDGLTNLKVRAGGRHRIADVGCHPLRKISASDADRRGRLFSAPLGPASEHSPGKSDVVDAIADPADVILTRGQRHHAGAAHATKGRLHPDYAAKRSRYAY